MYANLLSLILLLFFGAQRVKGKGAAVIGAASGSGAVCVECAGNYTEEEMQMALWVVGCILTVFFIILACQCYSRVMWECVEDPDLMQSMKHMPPPPYFKSYNIA